MSPALEAATHTTVPTVRIAAPRRGIAPPERHEHDGRRRERHQRHAGGGVRRDADEADDARRDHDEREAEDRDAEAATKRGPGAMFPARRPGPRTARSPPRRPASTTQPGSRGRCAATPRPRRTSLPRSPQHRAQGRVHGRQRRAHGDDARRRHRARADVADVARPDLAARQVADGPRRLGEQRLGRPSPTSAISGMRPARR
jgi:hypothetical protein